MNLNTSYNQLSCSRHKILAKIYIWSLMDWLGSISTTFHSWNSQYFSCFPLKLCPNPTAATVSFKAENGQVNLAAT